MLTAAGEFQKRDDYIRGHDIGVETQARHLLDAEFSVFTQHLKESRAARVQDLFASVRARLNPQIIGSWLQRLQAGISSADPGWIIAILQKAGGWIQHLWIFIKRQIRTPFCFRGPAGNGLAPVVGIVTPSVVSVVDPKDILLIGVEKIPARYELTTERGFERAQAIRLHDQVQSGRIIHAFK